LERCRRRRKKLARSRSRWMFLLVMRWFNPGI